MKKLLFIGVLLAFFIPLFAHSPIAEAHVPSKEEMMLYTKNSALEAKLSPERVINVIGCETKGTWKYDIQSDYPNKADGGRELSFGLAQIHLPDHRDISYEEAINPYFAVNFLIREWSKGNLWQWSCAHRLGYL